MAQLNMRGKLKKAPAANMVKYINQPGIPDEVASEGLYFNLEKYLIEHTGMDAGDKVTLLVRATTSAARTVLHSCIKSFSTGQKTLGESAEGGEGRAPQNSHI